VKYSVTCGADPPVKESSFSTSSQNVRLNDELSAAPLLMLPSSGADVNGLQLNSSK
jgi:hypothetical protein